MKAVRAVLYGMAVIGAIAIAVKVVLGKELHDNEVAFVALSLIYLAGRWAIAFGEEVLGK